MNLRTLKPMVEAILMAADSPVSIERLIKLLDDENSNLPTKEEVCKIIEGLREDYSGHGVELIEVASGYRFRARADYGDRIVRLREERRPRYSRALLETLAIIAYRQPITRGEIEHIRGVAVSTNIMRSLLEREWVRVVGHRDVPGHPGLYATTKQFLDYFGMKSLEEMPTLAQLKDVDDFNAGDTVISVAALGLALNLPSSMIAQLANIGGGLVCEHMGVVPVNKDDLFLEAKKYNL